RSRARLLAVFTHVDPRSESPMETRLRLLLIRAGLPWPDVQYVVLDDDGRFVARVDLAYAHLRIAMEYDGDHHRDRDTFARDVRRQNALVQLGWTVLRFTARDVYRSPERVVAEVRTAFAAAA